MESIKISVLDQNHFFELINDAIYISSKSFTLAISKLDFYEVITWLKETQLQINKYTKLGGINVFPSLLNKKLHPLCKIIVQVYITYDSDLYFNIKYYNIESVSFDVIKITEFYNFDKVIQQLI